MNSDNGPPPLGWLGILRLGLVQTALGAIVVLTTSTLNRVMVVELALPAMLPGALVALHYGLQFLRPRWGHGSDSGGRRTPNPPDAGRAPRRAPWAAVPRRDPDQTRRPVTGMS